MVHPTPRTFPSTREASFVVREALECTLIQDALHEIRFTCETVASTGFVPIYSGGTARASTLFPYSKALESSTIGEGWRGCQALLTGTSVPMAGDGKSLMLVSVQLAMVVSHSSTGFHFREKEYDRGAYV